MIRFPEHTVYVHAPSRLHFGLLPLDRQARQGVFGGVGAMVDRPGIEIKISPSRRFEVCGPLHKRAREFAVNWAAETALTTQPDCRIEVLSAPTEHVGLGVGTQLALSVAAGLDAFYGESALCPKRLDRLVLLLGRSRRSSVGALGFLHGGMIAHSVPRPSISHACVHGIPDSWRFVLIRPLGKIGLAGISESSAFDALPPASAILTNQMVEELNERLLPALVDRRFDDFSESLYRYGYGAGMYFSRRQGGAYNGPELEKIVHVVRSLGVLGAGQSSWGPTVFALLPNPAAADEFVAQLRLRLGSADFDLCIAAPNNGGARVEVDR